MLILCATLLVLAVTLVVLSIVLGTRQSRRSDLISWVAVAASWIAAGLAVWLLWRGLEGPIPTGDDYSNRSGR